MKRYFQLAALIVASALVAALAPGRAPAADPKGEQHVFLNAEELKWQAAPPGLPAGAKAAVLFGDPHAEGHFVVRLSTPAGYKIPPHWHTRAENLTIISGALYIGLGDRFDYSQAHAMRAGGYHYLPAKAHHFAFSDMPTVVQIEGEGPFDINYLNPVDDPRNQRR